MAIRDSTRRVIRLMIEAGFIRKEFKAAVDRDPASTEVEVIVGGRWNGKRLVHANELIEKRMNGLLSVGLGVERTKLRDGRVVWRVHTDTRFSGQFIETEGV